jgi:Mg2+ and Co2+ transporter CorA
MGVPAKFVQEILGHSHISITLGIYAHVLPGMHKEAMNKMDDWFGNDEEKTNPKEKGELRPRVRTDTDELSIVFKTYQTIEKQVYKTLISETSI